MDMVESFRSCMGTFSGNAGSVADLARDQHDASASDLASYFRYVRYAGKEGEDNLHGEFPGPSMLDCIRNVDILHAYVSVREEALSNHELSDRSAAGLDRKAALYLMQPLGIVRFSYAGNYLTKASLPVIGAETVPFDAGRNYCPAEEALQYFDETGRQYLEGEVGRVQKLLSEAYPARGSMAMHSLSNSLVSAGMADTSELDLDPEGLLDRNGRFHVGKLAGAMSMLALARMNGLSDDPEGYFAQAEQKAASLAGVVCEEMLPEECLDILKEKDVTFERLGEGVWFASAFLARSADDAVFDHIMERLHDGPGQGLYEGECIVEGSSDKKKGNAVPASGARASEIVLRQAGACMEKGLSEEAALG